MVDQAAVLLSWSAVSSDFRAVTTLGPENP